MAGPGNMLTGKSMSVIVNAKLYPIWARLFSCNMSGEGGENLTPLKFSPKTLTIELKLWHVVRYTLKSLSVEKN